MSSPEQSHPELSPTGSAPSLRAVPDPAPAEADAEHERWERLSNGFVDDPRGSVREADQALREQIHKLINRLSSMQSRMMRQCDAREDASTEDLRECFQQYRELSRRVAEMTPKD